MTVGVLRLFVSAVTTARATPDVAVDGTLEQLASAYGSYSYVGPRRALEDLVLSQCGAVVERVRSLTANQLSDLEQADPEFADKVRGVRALGDSAATHEVADHWFRKNWKKDSGLFPDFVLALDGTPTFGDGAILELKDSKGGSIASFNSTIPARLKSLAEVTCIMGSRSVSAAARIRDLPLSLCPGYLATQRHCFYLIRTHASQAQEVRISFVEGSFFETVPKATLLEDLWKQLLGSAGLTEEESATAVSRLAGLSQTEIARSRELGSASIKPRLRLMAEVHPDANPHRYDGLGPQTANLVVKAEWEHDTQWIKEVFAAEGIAVHCEEGHIQVQSPNGTPSLQLRHFRITHKLNGPHLVLQYHLPAEVQSS